MKKKHKANRPIQPVVKFAQSRATVIFPYVNDEAWAEEVKAKRALIRQRKGKK